MKTKKLFIIVGSLFSLLGLGGCVKNPAPVVEGSRFESDFLFTNIVVPNEIGIFPAVYNDGTDEPAFSDTFRKGHAHAHGCFMEPHYDA